VEDIVSPAGPGEVGFAKNRCVRIMCIAGVAWQQGTVRDCLAECLEMTC